MKFQERLLQCLRDPSQVDHAGLDQMSSGLTRLILEINGASEEEMHRLADLVDESPYPLKDWASALCRFQEWEEQHRKLDLTHKIEYLSCCVEGLKTPERLLSLPDLLSEYLRTHGVA